MEVRTPFHLVPGITITRNNNRCEDQPQMPWEGAKLLVTSVDDVSALVTVIESQGFPMEVGSTKGIPRWLITSQYFLAD